MAEFRWSEGRSRLARLHQAGCLKLRFPRLHGPDVGAEAVLINSSGGVTGGDRLAQEFTVGEGAQLTVTTQACERVYRALAGQAEITTSVSVAPDAGFAFLPQETILFDGGALGRRLDVEAAASSRLLLVESVVLGRTLMGETVMHGSFHDRWRIRRDGQLVFADDLRLSGTVAVLSAEGAVLAGAAAFATILVQRADADTDLDAALAILGDAGGASPFDGLLVARLVAKDGFSLRKRLVPLLALLARRPLPLVWSI